PGRPTWRRRPESRPPGHLSIREWYVRVREPWLAAPRVLPEPGRTLHQYRSEEAQSMAIRRVFMACAAAFVILLVGAGGLVLNFLDQWGVSWRTASQINHRLDADRAAVRDAEGPVRAPEGIAERGFVRIGGI